MTAHRNAEMPCPAQCMQSRPEAGMQKPIPFSLTAHLHHRQQAQTSCIMLASLAAPLFCSPLVAPPTLECPRWGTGEPNHSTREDCRCRCRELGDGLVLSSFCLSPIVIIFSQVHRRGQASRGDYRCDHMWSFIMGASPRGKAGGRRRVLSWVLMLFCFPVLATIILDCIGIHDELHRQRQRQRQ